jgi:hypothetical protein
LPYKSQVRKLGFMKNSYVLFSALVAYAIVGSAAPPQKPTECQQTARPFRISARHIEGGGIGYTQGYTSLDLFFSHLWNQSLPFLDLRGHVFNNGRFAANAGLGYRHLWKQYIFGANAYYDYRNTNRYHYNQVSAGFEVLARRWDLRINGYLPVGPTHTGWYRSDFAGFQGHYLFVRQKQEFSMRGLNAEAGAYSDRFRSFWCYGGIGPYYYEGKGKNAYGGRARFNVNYGPYVTMEVSGSYDNVFHGIVQGQFALNVPFGPRGRRKTESIPDWCALRERLVQPVQREEIVVVDHRYRKSVAIDPATGLPYYFIFVNNTSSSLGTFESPYPTLDQALAVSNPNDIIYIFTGDGTATGLTTSTGYTLLDNQQLLGSGMNYTFPTTAGDVVVLPLQAGQPALLLSIGGVLITPGNNATIAGLFLQANGEPAQCILKSGSMTDLKIVGNLIEPIGTNTSVGVVAGHIQGTFTFENNTFTSTGGGPEALGITEGGGPLFADVIGNIFNNGVVTIAGGDSSPVCIRYNNNSSDSPATFSATGIDCVVNVEPLIGNNPNTYTPSEAGTVNNVPAGTCQ